MALLAAGSWRAIGAAVATALTAALASGFVYGFSLWPLWAHALFDYAHSFPGVLDYMPTIEANARLLGAPPALAQALQVSVALLVAGVVWRVWRDGPSPRAAALLIVGTFLATPHALNYDMPMLTAALLTYFFARRREGLDVAEAFALALAFLTPFLMKELRGSGMPLSFAPLGLMFCLLAWPRPSNNIA